MAIDYCTLSQGLKRENIRNNNRVIRVNGPEGGKRVNNSSSVASSITFYSG